MARARANGVDLFYDLHGDGGNGAEPLVLVHGSWIDHRTWRDLVPHLARSFRVLAYDRRGHGRSASPPGRGSRRQDEDDLAALIEALDLAPAHVVGNSFGAATALGLAARRPELLRSLAAHEPPLVGVVPGRDFHVQGARDSLAAVRAALRAGESEAAARCFVEEVALGPGVWPQLPRALRELFVANAPTFADELADPHWCTLDLAALSGYQGPALLTSGSLSPAWFPPILAELAPALGRARVRTLEGDGHDPHVAHPARYADTLTAFIRDSGRPTAP
ncbi:alpha/beta hydrolase [Streptomyces sp. NPDC051183]|uniref:alpha/beta fold hydrolase n=1 Tax=unclassified Streptomyces TaxID=2593676 RepID=UPI00341A634F